MELFICPVCMEKGRNEGASALRRVGGALKCSRGHSFDVSARGYVNLLLAQHKNVKDPGDGKEMAAARREFLNTGAYKPLLDAVCAAAAKLTDGVRDPVVADCGCGEGYYTAGIYDALAEKGSPKIYAVDISKNALSVAKPRFAGKAVYPAAASVFRLPIGSGTADLATVIFAPLCAEELLRILKPRGCLIMVIPAREHLFALKQLLYEKPYYNEVKPYELKGFAFLGRDEVRGAAEITEQAVLNALFMMTPYYYKTSPKDSARLYSYFEEHDKFTVETAFEILKYRKEVSV